MATTIFFWFGFALLIAIWADRRGRSGLGWFLLAATISPLLAGLLLAILGPIQTTGHLAEGPERGQCPHCLELVVIGAHKCKHCGSLIDQEHWANNPPTPAQAIRSRPDPTLERVVLVVLLMIGALVAVSAMIS